MMKYCGRDALLVSPVENVQGVNDAEVVGSMTLAMEDVLLAMHAFAVEQVAHELTSLFT